MSPLKPTANAPSDKEESSSSSKEAERAGKAAAFRLLARRNLTRRELSLKLSARGFDEKTTTRVLAACERLHYVNDNEFALAYRKQMTQKGYGARRIRMAMKQKGFTARQIDAAFSDYDLTTDENRVAAEVLARKINTLRHLSNDLRKKEKLYRFLYSRGFTQSTIFESFRTIQPDTDTGST
ncbi:MAG: regulatory protein RecX [Desulfobacterales bacterium]|jgi:regulatory protein|nr:regulatory protein RecX [Desulfobacterales bacterium]